MVQISVDNGQCGPNTDITSDQVVHTRSADDSSYEVMYTGVAERVKTWGGHF